ncbi:MAG: acetoacetate--CoA ligase [Nitriliruptorales bacterium]|nr:acetoacetate--CoA ligase [Nitriliruptorales bacterium]
MTEVLWSPSPERVAASNLARFATTVGFDPTQYQKLWQWSVDEPGRFWDAVWRDSGVVAGRDFDEVLADPRMPGARWFVGARLNYAENLLRHRGALPAVVAAGEGLEDRVVSRDELYALVARAQQGLRQLGVVAGDRVAAFTPNCLEAVVVMLAATAMGAVWSSSSPDFGVKGVVDRFAQIRPRVLLTTDGYRYGGKTHTLQDRINGVASGLPGLEHVVVADFTGEEITVHASESSSYAQLLDNSAGTVHFEQVGPDHPLFIMYSSGTTGVPKSIVHSHAGSLLTHYKEHRLHVDLHEDNDTIFWFTTCGWMMWNWLVSSLASGAAIVLYDGSPTHPGAETLWRLAERHRITHFGTSPKFLSACENVGLRPSTAADLAGMRTLLSTGSPLNPEQFDWVYGNVGDDIHLASISGGTDLLGCFVGGVPTLPVRRGELQGVVLGMAVEAWNEQGQAVVGERGELVCTKPFPSMPVGFWNDDGDVRYHAAYFEQNPGVWTHGDFIELRPGGGAIIHGRSDTTLNPGGIRIGTAEIYRAVESLPEILDSIVVGRPADGDVEVVLCLKLREAVTLDDALVRRVKTTIRTATTPRHVPAHIFEVSDIPYTISGKKVEKAVRDTIMGAAVHNRDALANPEALEAYRSLPFPA